MFSNNRNAFTSSSEEAEDDNNEEEKEEEMMDIQTIDSIESEADRQSENVDETWERLRLSQHCLDPVVIRRRRRVVGDDDDDDGYTRLVCMSDTHGQHRRVFLPAGDVLIHAGDFTQSGEVESIQDLSCYFQESSFDEIVCIAGNHDVTLHPTFYQREWHKFHREPLSTTDARAALQHCIYLQDEARLVSNQRVCIYGSPWSPEFYGWAFNLPRGQPIREVWSKIPSDTDVLITHGPPLGRGDFSLTQHVRAGCYDLLVQVQQRVKPRVHVFGHIHEGYGVSYDGQTLFVNASNLNVLYQPVNQCVVIDLPHDETQPAMLVQPNCTLSSHDFIRWCQEKGYQRLAAQLSKISGQKIPSGNDLLQTDTFQVLSEELQLHRDEESRKEFRRALSQLIAESY